MNKITIEPFKSENFRDLAEVFLISFREPPIDFSLIKETANKFKNLSSMHLVQFYIAKDRERMVGLGGIIVYEGSSFIGYLGVIPPYRNQGIGTKLFKILFHFANKFNSVVELFANLGALNLYKKFGFKEQFSCNRYELFPEEKKSRLRINEFSSIPKWIYNLDRKIMGYNRSILLDCLFYKMNFSLIGVKKSAFLLYDKSDIGPVISNNFNAGIELINYALKENPRNIIIPVDLNSKLSMFSLKKVHETRKMIHEGKSKQIKSGVIGYYSYATG